MHNKAEEKNEDLFQLATVGDEKNKTWTRLIVDADRIRY